MKFVSEKLNLFCQKKIIKCRETLSGNKCNSNKYAYKERRVDNYLITITYKHHLGTTFGDIISIFGVDIFLNEWLYKTN